MAAAAELFPRSRFGFHFHFAEDKIKDSAGIRFRDVFSNETAHHILLQFHKRLDLPAILFHDL